jgi:hypothetical protein
VIPVFGCETARELLEPFVDGELTTAQQVAVQSHLRSCPTCSARIDDMSLIGWSIRTGPTGPAASVDSCEFSVMAGGILERVRAERQQSLRSRLAEWCSDMRLIWPAIGASAAVVLCLVGAANVWRLTTERSPDSLAALLENAENPGSDRNPLRLEDISSAPRVLHDGLAFDDLADGENVDGERMVMVAALVTQGGRVGGAEVLDLPGVFPPGELTLSDGQEVLDKMLTWQLTPAQSRSGRPVAVRVVYLFAQTTAVKEVLRPVESSAGPRPHPVERTKEPASPVGTRSAIESGSATA